MFTVGGACLQKEEHINGAVGLGGDFILSVSNDFCEKNGTYNWSCTVPLKDLVQNYLTHKVLKIPKNGNGKPLKGKLVKR